MLTAALAASALLAGLAGAWSPCGFSMVDTIAAPACEGRRRGTLPGAGAFTVGALAGGVVTFGGLAWAGAALGAGGGSAAAVTAAVLLVAALGDAAGRRIVPQVRRQVPESWRRVMPLPVAAGLYGVLLGLGFTTFVLSFATYALAAACLALGDPLTGAAVGVAFGIGRSLPVAVLGPLQDTDAGLRAAAAMAERPGVLRGFRAAAAGGLTLAALALALEPAPARAAFGSALAPAAQAAPVRVAEGTDPSAAGDALAWQALGGTGMVRRGDRVDAIPGLDPAVGGSWAAWRESDRIRIAPLATLQPVGEVSAPGAEELAISDRWLVWRDRDAEGRQRLLTMSLVAGGGPEVRYASPVLDGDVGRPALDGDRLAFHLSTPRSSRIVVLDLASRQSTETVGRRGTQLLQPSLLGDALLFVRASSRRQKLVLAVAGARQRTLWSTTPTARRDAGRERGRRHHRAGYPKRRRPRQAPRPRPGTAVTMWTTALAADTAYVTLLRHHRRRPTTADILAVRR